MNKLHIKKGDKVEVISGVSKGSRGKVLEVSPSDKQVIIEGVHMVTKHVKPRSAKQQGGIIKAEGPGPCLQGYARLSQVRQKDPRRTQNS